MTKAKILVISVIALAGVALAAGLFIQARNNAAPALAFEFDSSSHDGWWSAGNTNVQDSARSANYSEASYGPISDLPTASISVHHGGPNDEQPEDRCFLSFAYYDQPLKDIEAAYSNYESKLNESGTFEQIGSHEKTLPTPEGVKSYNLHSYHTKAGAPGEYMSGTQVGFLKLNEGHIEVRGTCQTPEDTALTLPVMDAVSLKNATHP